MQKKAPLHIEYAYAQTLMLKLGFPGGSTGKESACNVGDLGSIPGLGRSPGEGKGYPFQCSGLENSTDCIVDGVAKSRIQLSDFHQTQEWKADEERIALNSTCLC